ncbi:hypothetical protein RY27_22900 [Litorilinea aerophila]|nr:hypothetical protein RY27_22900 [Litorilinea aerophila]
MDRVREPVRQAREISPARVGAEGPGGQVDGRINATFGTLVTMASSHGGGAMSRMARWMDDESWVWFQVFDYGERGKLRARHHI